MKSTYTLALNHLADLSRAEMKGMRGYKNTGINSKYIYKPTTQDLPDFMNWWLRGIMVLYII